MARFWFVTEVLFLLSAAVFSLAFDSSQITVPKTESVSGVFLITDGGNYTFNFTAAKAACLLRNVTIATRVQMQEALQHGLETCKYGWIAEQVAVVPRITGNKNCGRNGTGLVTWRTSAGTLFGVFCFSAADLDKTLTSSSSVTALPPVTPLLTSQSRRPSSAKPTATEVSSPTSVFTQLDQTTHSAALSSTSRPLKPFSSHITPSLSNFITSSATVHISPSASVSSSSPFAESVLSQTVRSAEPSLGDLDKTLTSSSSVTALPPVTPLLTSQSRRPSSAKPTATEVSSPTSVFTQLDQTTHSAALSSTSRPLKPFSSHITPSLSNFITSSATVHISPSASVSSSSPFAESVLSQTVRSAEPSLGAVPIALIILGIMALVTATGAVCF